MSVHAGTNPAEKEVILMTLIHRVSSTRLSAWAKRHPGVHRSLQQGHQIVCPIGDGVMFRVQDLDGTTHRTRVCPLCFATLKAPVVIPGEDKEVQWSPA